MWSEETERYGSREEDLAAAGDIDAIVELNLRFWVAGPTRSHAEVDPTLRAFVGDMQRDALVMQLAQPDVEGGALVPDPADRLAEIAVPTLVLVGDLDIPEMREGAARLAAAIPGARAATIAGASHLPNLERPEEFDALVLEFLGDVED